MDICFFIVLILFCVYLPVFKVRPFYRYRLKINQLGRFWLLLKSNFIRMNYPAAEPRGIKMNFYLINPDAEHRGILLIKFT